MIIPSNPVRKTATQATCTQSFQECVLSFPDLNLIFFFFFFITFSCLRASNKVRVACNSNYRDNGNNSHIPVG